MASHSVPQRKPWKKNLYENEGYPDNYTDVSFLEELKKNINMRQVTFKEAFLGASLVTQELCLVVFFSIIFVYMYNEWAQADWVFFITCALSFCGYVIYVYLESNVKLRHFRATFMFFLLGYILSPVLKTLTESISTDTIYATTVFMMAVHLTFFDYGVKAFIVSSSLSINAAIFGSLCLASRLATPFHAFVLLATSVECFVLCPLLLSKMGNSVLIIFGMTALTIHSLWTLSSSMTLLFILTVIFINLVCPYLFVRWHTYKDNIYGPWDEAVVQDIQQM